MTFDVRAIGVGTISPTQVAGVTSTKEGLPYVDITNSDTRSFISASSHVAFGIRKSVHDTQGSVGIHFTILTNSSARVYADRSFPADGEIVFDWISIQD